MARAPAAFVAVLVAVAAVAPAAAELGPMCAKLAQDMNMSEALVEGYAATLPVPPSRDFCGWLTTNLTTTQACDFLSLLYFGFSGGGKDDKPPCDPSWQAPYQQAPPGNISSLRDARPLPPAFSEDQAAELFAEEGQTYYWLFRMAENVWARSFCANEPQADAVPLVLPPGWAVDAVANITQGADPPLQALYVLHNQATNQLVYLIRSSISGADWGADFNMSHTTDPEVEQLFGGAGIHAGYADVFTQLWPAVRNSLDERVVNAKGPVPSVVVTGHSLGAAVASLTAYAAQQYLDAERGSTAPTVDAVLFAPPQAGDAVFSELYGKLVNSRSIAYADDVIHQVPCAPEMPACPARASGLLGQLGVTGVPTNQDNATAWAYEPVPGSLTFGPADMPYDGATWGRIKSMPLCWAADFLRASHTCSYMCYLSELAGDQSVDGSMCWLSAKPGDAPGSQCTGFPNGWLSPMAAAPAPALASAPPPTAAAVQAAVPAVVLALAALAAVLMG